MQMPPLQTHAKVFGRLLTDAHLGGTQRLRLQRHVELVQFCCVAPGELPHGGTSSKDGHSMQRKLALQES